MLISIIAILVAVVVAILFWLLLSGNEVDETIQRNTIPKSQLTILGSKIGNEYYNGNIYNYMYQILPGNGLVELNHTLIPNGLESYFKIGKMTILVVFNGDNMRYNINYGDELQMYEAYEVLYDIVQQEYSNHK